MVPDGCVKFSIVLFVIRLNLVFSILSMAEVLRRFRDMGRGQGTGKGAANLLRTE